MKTTIPAYPLVADIQPNAGAAFVRLTLNDGTLLPVAQLMGPSDHKEAYGYLFAASLDMHCELKCLIEILRTIQENGQGSVNPGHIDFCLSRAQQAIDFAEGEVPTAT